MVVDEIVEERLRLVNVVERYILNVVEQENINLTGKESPSSPSPVLCDLGHSSVLWLCNVGFSQTLDAPGAQ